jgi:hypothetical protein
VLEPLIELSTLDLEDMQLPMNLNFIQHPVPSASPSFFFLPFDFSTSQAPTPIASGPNPISQKIPKLTPISQKYHIPPLKAGLAHSSKPKNIKMHQITLTIKTHQKQIPPGKKNRSNNQNSTTPIRADLPLIRRTQNDSNPCEKKTGLEC